MIVYLIPLTEESTKLTTAAVNNEPYFCSINVPSADFQIYVETAAYRISNNSYMVDNDLLSVYHTLETISPDDESICDVFGRTLIVQLALSILCAVVVIFMFIITTIFVSAYI